MADSGGLPSALRPAPALLALQRADAAAPRVISVPRGPAVEVAAAPAAASPETAARETRQAAAAAEARREERLRAIGRQLDEEAAQRDAAAAAGSARPLPSASPLRRGRLFGLADPDTELILYAEAWARKIQLNLTFELVREAARRPHADPLVTVAVRSDGSIESVTFVRSSGVAELDEAIRRVVQSQRPYPPFSPALARTYDVIEIRRTWHFDMAIRLY
jgi:TonB family protein